MVRFMVRARDALHAINLPSDSAEEAEYGAAATCKKGTPPEIVKVIDAFMQKNGKVTPPCASKTMAEFFGTRRGIAIFEDSPALVFKYNSTKEDISIEEEESESPPVQTTCFSLLESRRFSMRGLVLSCCLMHWAAMLMRWWS